MSILHQGSANLTRFCQKDILEMSQSFSSLDLIDFKGAPRLSFKKNGRSQADQNPTEDTRSHKGSIKASTPLRFTIPAKLRNRDEYSLIDSEDDYSSIASERRRGRTPEDTRSNTPLNPPALQPRTRGRTKYERVIGSLEASLNNAQAIIQANDK